MNVLCIWSLTILNIVSAITFKMVTGDVISGEIYSLDNLVAGESTILSLEVREGNVTVSQQDDYVPGQRFVARVNSDNTFNLFLEEQSWNRNWVEYIVESSQIVNIRETPRILDVQITNGTKELIQSNYRGTSANSQKWYLVPFGSEPDTDTGVVTNLLHRECITSNGVGNVSTLRICNQNDRNQIFRLTKRSQGRCY